MTQRRAQPDGFAPGTVPLVLVVDDQPGVQTLLRTALSEDGYRVAVAGDRSSVRRKLAAGIEPDCALVDFKLPGANGLQVVRELRSALPGTPVLMVSALEHRRTVDAAREAGAQDVLFKPFDLYHLRDRVARAMAGRATQT